MTTKVRTDTRSGGTPSELPVTHPTPMRFAVPIAPRPAKSAILWATLRMRCNGKRGQLRLLESPSLRATSRRCIARDGREIEVK